MKAFFNDCGLFILRVVFGVTMLAHGVQNVLITGPAKGIAFYGKVGIPDPHILFWVGNVTEIAGGIALILGILTRLAALGEAIVMGGAVYYVHLAGGFFEKNKGYEYVLVLTVIGVALLLTGPGRWSIDYFLFGRKPKAVTTVVAPTTGPVAADPAAAPVAEPQPALNTTTPTTTTVITPGSQPVDPDKPIVL